MKIKKQSSLKSKKVVIPLLILLVALVTAGAFFAINYNNDQNAAKISKKDRGINSIDYGAPTKEQQDAGNDTDPDNPGSDRPLPPRPQEDGKSLVDMSITSANNDGSSFKVGTLISVVDDSGKCTLTLSKGAEKVVKEVGVQALPSSSTCKGFTIPMSELSKGEWTLAIRFENETLTGTATQKVEI